jgi:hypothetical protein
VDEALAVQPAAHAPPAGTSAYVPGPQPPQAPPACARAVPAAQVEHEAAPPLDHVPAAHATQLEAPGPEAKEPAAQLLQPPPCRNEPGAQTVHALAPPSE